MGKHNYTHFFFYLNVLFADVVLSVYLTTTTIMSRIEDTGQLISDDESLEQEFISQSLFNKLLAVLKTDVIWNSSLFFVYVPILSAATVGVMFLFLYHWIFVVTKNNTTYEQIKKSYTKIRFHWNPRTFSPSEYFCCARVYFRLFRSRDEAVVANPRLLKPYARSDGF